MFIQTSYSYLRHIPDKREIKCHTAVRDKGQHFALWWSRHEKMNCVEWIMKEEKQRSCQEGWIRALAGDTVTPVLVVQYLPVWC